MARSQTPSGIAASTKVIVDAVKTTFGAAVVVLFFFGVSMVSLASGLGNLGPELRGSLIQQLIWFMVGVLILLVLLRIVKPAGLGGPPQPETEHVQIKNSKVD
jgi:hypothetical protein